MVRASPTTLPTVHHGDVGAIRLLWHAGHSDPLLYLLLLLQRQSRWRSLRAPYIACLPDTFVWWNVGRQHFGFQAIGEVLAPS